MKKYITWDEIFIRAIKIKNKYPNANFWGVPRGGQVVAGIIGNAVDNIQDCDVIVDDLIDSG